MNPFHMVKQSVIFIILKINYKIKQKPLEKLQRIREEAIFYILPAVEMPLGEVCN